MSAFFSSTARKVGLALVFAASLSAVSSTSSFAFSAEAQAMCRATRSACAAPNGNIPKITACMIRQRASLQRAAASCWT